jgi:hypothetical protein
MNRQVRMRFGKTASAICIGLSVVAVVRSALAGETLACPGFAALVLDTNISTALRTRNFEPPNPVRVQTASGQASEVPAWAVKPLAADARESVYPLGQGQAGGKVSKVVPWDGSKSYVRKEYFTEISFENDVRGLSLLREIFGQRSTVKVAEVLKVKPPKTLHPNVESSATGHRHAT